MSASRLYVIDCDDPDCGCPGFTSTTDDLTEARRQAAKAGWTYEEESDTDWSRGHIRFTATEKVLA